MSQSELRLEVLDLLARGKITTDQAARLLDGSAELAEAINMPEPETLKEEVKKEAASVIPVEEMAPAASKGGAGGDPRWLRIRVGTLDTGRDKVTVNIPFGMVKFGLGMARLFGGEKVGMEVADWEAMLPQMMGTGVLVDVEDAESNEHVRIYVD